MTREQLLALIEANFEKVQDRLMSKYGNAGQDIGDAGTAGELIRATIETFLYDLADNIEIALGLDEDLDPSLLEEPPTT